MAGRLEQVDCLLLVFFGLLSLTHGFIRSIPCTSTRTLSWQARGFLATWNDDSTIIISSRGIERRTTPLLLPLFASDGGDYDTYDWNGEAGEPKAKDPLLEQYERWCDQVGKTLKSLRKKQKSLLSELERAEHVEDTVHRAELLTSNMYLFTPGVRTATVVDWNNDGKEVEVTLDETYDSASAEADALFQRARKLKRGSQVVSHLLEETNAALETMEELEMDLKASVTLKEGASSSIVDENRFFLVQNRLLATGCFSPPDDVEKTRRSDSHASASSSSNRRKPELGTPASNVRKFTTPGGCTVLVGRNRRGNEYITFNQAKGEDFWMHSRGCPGAHVVLMQRRGGPTPTEDCIQFAADVAVFYSDARSELSFDVTVGKPRHLLKPRGAPLGAVKLRQEEAVRTGYPDQVPEELKLAREESGQAEEYRLNDKAKHRRRTKEATKKQQAKRNAARTKSKRRSRSMSNE